MTYLLVALVVGVGAAAQATSGFGFALLTVPLLAVLIGPKTAVVTDNVVGIGLATLVAFTVTGKITGAVGRAAVAGYAAIVPGLLAGERLAARIDTRRFRVVVLAMLVASALASIVRALS